MRRLHLAAIAFYGLLGFLALYKLIFNIGGLVTSGPLNDIHLFTWNYWWADFALFRLGQDPYFSNFLLYPQTHNLSAHTLALSLLPFHKLLYPLAGNPATLNIILWASFAFNGWSAFLFLRAFGRPNATFFPLLGGALFALSPAALDHAFNAHANMWLLGWLALLPALWNQLAKAARTGWPKRIFPLIFLLGVGLWAALLSDLQFMLWLAFLLGPFALRDLVLAGAGFGRVLAVGLLSLALFALLAGIAPLPALQVGLNGPVSPARYLTAEAYSLTPAGLLGLSSPNALTDQRQSLFLLPLTLLAIIFGRGRSRWLWLGLALLPLVLALGPTLQAFGTEIPLPYRLLHDLLGGLYRFPSRFAPVALLALLIFIAVSLRWRPRLWLAIAALCLLLIETRALAPLAVTAPPKTYALYNQIATLPGDFVLLHVPVTIHSGWRQVGGAEGQRAMWYQTIHHKRQINGSLSRIPNADHLYFTDDPALGYLSNSRSLSAEAATAFADHVKAYPVGVVAVHLDWLAKLGHPDGVEGVLAWLNQRPELCFWQQEADLVAYKARWLGCEAAPQQLEIIFGQTDMPYLAGGWYGPEQIGGVSGRWARAEAALQIRLANGPAQLTLSGLALTAGQTLAVYAGDTLLATFDLLPSWAEYRVEIPAQAGDTLLRLQAGSEASPQALSLGADTRFLAFALHHISLSMVTDAPK
jgi:hypothetical protein